MLLPAEILLKIYTFLTYKEIYRLRSVCTFWKLQCEYQLWILLKSRQQKLFIKIGERENTCLIDMLPYNYDAENQVIEFRGSDEATTEEEEENDVYMYPSSSRRTQIHFSEWEHARNFENNEWTHDLTIVDRAFIMFHANYNPSLEQVYQIPTPKDSTIRYMGDQGMVMRYSYIYPTTNKQPQPQVQFHSLQNRNSSFAFDDDEPTTSNPIRLRVHAVFVNFSWLFSGMQPHLTPQPLYATRYQALNDLLKKQGIKQSWSSYSEQVLQYIMSSQQQDYDLLLFEQQEQGSKMDELKNKLQSIGIDPRVIWKYTFAKNYILRDQNHINVEDVARVIQRSEQDWMTKKLELSSLNRRGA